MDDGGGIVSKTAMANLRRHLPHIQQIAQGGDGMKAILHSNKDNVARALGTMAKIAHHRGLIPQELYEKHGAKLRKLLNNRTHMKTRHRLMQSQRGGSLFKKLARGFVKGFTHVFKKVGPTAAGFVGSLYGGPAGGAAAKEAASNLLGGGIDEDDDEEYDEY